MTDDTEARLKLIEETLEDPDDFIVRELRWAVEEIRRIGRERDLLLLIVRSATQLIENEANFTAQSYACVNNLRNLIADWKGHG
ncbi:MAG: hypothetical protein ACE5FA_00105 [Dehalococcoidia bacterium]